MRAADATGRFLTVVAGNLPGPEEASRAIYGGKREQFEEMIRDRPADIRAHAWRMVRDALRAE